MEKAQCPEIISPVGLPRLCLYLYPIKLALLYFCQYFVPFNIACGLRKYLVVDDPIVFSHGVRGHKSSNRLFNSLPESIIECFIARTGNIISNNNSYAFCDCDLTC